MFSGIKNAAKPNLETFVKVKRDAEKDDFKKSVESRKERPIPEKIPGVAWFSIKITISSVLAQSYLIIEIMM